MSGPHFSAPPLGPRWQTHRQFGCTLLARLRVVTCARVWNFPEARYHITPKTLSIPRPAAPTGPRTGRRARATTESRTTITVPMQPTANYCNLLYLPTIYRKVPGALSCGSCGLSCPITLTRTVSALPKSLRTVHTPYNRNKHNFFFHSQLEVCSKNLKQVSFYVFRSLPVRLHKPLNLIIFSRERGRGNDFVCNK